MRVAVFGGSGFVGSHVADALTVKRHDVVIVDRQPSPYASAGQEMIVGDIRDGNLVDRAVHGCEVVYHFAGLADLDACRRLPIETVQANILGTVLLANACVKAHVSRFVYASTVYVYSSTGGFYRVSKQAAENYIEEFHRCDHLHFTILRYGTLYGPRADERNSVWRFLRAAIEDRRIVYPGNGEEIREYIHVADAARCSIDVLAPEYEDQHVVLTGQHPMRVRDLMLMIQEMVGQTVEVQYTSELAPGENDHYRVTPYSFQPRIARKLVSSYYLDMGQGLLQSLSEIAETLTVHGGAHAPITKGTRGV